MRKILVLMAVAMMVMAVVLAGCAKTPTEEKAGSGKETIEMVDEKGNFVGEAFKYSKYSDKKYTIPVKYLPGEEINYKDYTTKTFCLKGYTPSPQGCTVDTYACKYSPMPKEKYKDVCFPVSSYPILVGLAGYSCAWDKNIEKKCMDGYHLVDSGSSYLFACQKDDYVAPTGKESDICGDTGATLSSSGIFISGSYCCSLSKS